MFIIFIIDPDNEFAIRYVERKRQLQSVCYEEQWLWKAALPGGRQDLTQQAAVDNGLAVTDNECIAFDDNDIIHLPIKLEPDNAENTLDDEYLDDVEFLCSDGRPMVPIQIKSETADGVNNGTNQVIVDQVAPETAEPLAEVEPAVQNNLASIIQPVLPIQSPNERINIDVFSGNMPFEVSFVN